MTRQAPNPQTDAPHPGADAGAAASSTRAGPSFPVRVLVAGMLLSALAALGVHQWERAAVVRRIDEQVLDVESKINAQLAAHIALLRGAAGYFSTREWVDETEFRMYFGQVEVEDHYPGVQGVGLTLRLAPERVAEFEARARRNGLRDFRVWPEGPRPEYHTILYLEPDDERNRAAIGYDMHTNPVRRLAMDTARDTGEPAVTGRVTLVQEIDQSKQPGFLIYLPFYDTGEHPTTVAARRERLRGYAYAAFRAGDFLQPVIKPVDMPGVIISLYDGPRLIDDALIFSTMVTAADAGRPLVARRRTLKVVDRPWTLVYAAQSTGITKALSVGLLGFVASAGLAALLGRVEKARRRAERSEAATREREGELALLVDAVPALVSYIDRDMVFRLGNRRYAEWFGVEAGALAGRRMIDVVGPDVFRESEPYIRRALAGEGAQFDRWYNFPHIGSRYLGTIYVPHRGENGRIVGVYALSSDLTAHKRSEEAARFVADCGKLLIAATDFESTTRGIVHLAVPRVADTAIMFRVEGGDLRAVAMAHSGEAVERKMSEYFERIKLPISAQQNIGLAARTGAVVIAAELNPADLERSASDETQRELLRALELRSAMHVPVMVRGRIWAVFSFATSVRSGRQFTDEHRQLAEEISTRVRLAVENALLYREAQQEIEERRRAERVARETEEHFRLLIEGVRDYAIMSLDIDGRIESWNEGAQGILGYDEREAIGTPGARLYTPEDQKGGVPELELARAREKGASSDERWFVRRDDSRFWGSSHIAVLHHGDEVRGYAWIMRDLTERKRLEEELERRVQARTIELAEAVHELEAFSYSVSHDLKAPLRTIRGFTELALEEAGTRLNEEERGYLERVRRASARLDRLISDLLAYTRVSKTQVELRPVDLHALVSDIQREHPEFQAPRADVQITGALLPVIGNEAYLTQCVTNLLGNAVKFVHQGQLPSVRLWTERHGDFVRLHVQDKGIGIAPERLSKAFEMFERLHTTGSYEGTGVGLAIVRRAVQRMKGHVGLTSAVGQGTTFWLELPAA